MTTIFVFGSNLAGVHGAGSALAAHRHWGAEYGVGEGPTGRAYAIPTKDKKLRKLPLRDVAKSVARFLDYARAHPELIFKTVKVGCGLAGFREAEIRPLFDGAPDNVVLPVGWPEEWMK